MLEAPPGTELRYRKGFLAIPDPATDPLNLKAEVSSVLESALESTSIGVRAHVRALAASKLSLTLQVPADDVYFALKNARWMGSFEVVFVQFGPDGTRLVETRHPLALSFAQPIYEEILEQGLIFTKTVDLVDDAEVLKVVVVDSSTGRIGSLRIPLKSK